MLTGLSDKDVLYNIKKSSQKTAIDKDSK